VTRRTDLTVVKQWEDGNDLHSAQSVIVHLYADGVDTGKLLVLGAQNAWTGTFVDLPYYRPDGITPIVYSIVEEPMDGYLPEYSDPVYSDTSEADSWSPTTVLTDGAIHRFVVGSRALGCAADGSMASLADDPTNPYQWWIATNTLDGWYLTNVGSGKYLACKNKMFVTDDYGTALQFAGGMISCNVDEDGTSLIMIFEGYTSFSVYHKHELDQVPGYTITLYNAISPEYELPDTGGFGPEIPMGIGAALIAACFVLLRRRQRCD
jgi:LPXTG-motif cell wall-anchored protein